MGWKPKRVDVKTKGQLSPEIEEEFIMWRLINERIITLTEAKTTCTLDDAMRLTAILDYKQMLEEQNQ